MKIGFINGCFDMLHDGHIWMLMECRKHCDWLIVAVNSDEWIKHHKGPGRPMDNLSVRMRKVMPYANAVIPFSGRDDQLIMEIRPSVIFKGYDHNPDYAGQMAIRKPRWKELGPHADAWEIIPIVQIGHLPGFSTTLAIKSLTGGASETERDAQPRP